MIKAGYKLFVSQDALVELTISGSVGEIAKALDQIQQLRIAAKSGVHIGYPLQGILVAMAESIEKAGAQFSSVAIEGME